MVMFLLGELDLFFCEVVLLLGGDGVLGIVVEVVVVLFVVEGVELLIEFFWCVFFCCVL